jgi:amino acid adenylation domain-containing protein
MKAIDTPNEYQATHPTHSGQSTHPEKSSLALSDEWLQAKWNTVEENNPAKCIHEWFELQAARTPEATAVSCTGRHWSYTELNLRANQLAHHLINLGIGPEVPVAICLERSFEMIVAILATLKSGGAYAPMDPGYPKDRLSFMLGDTQSPALITQRNFAESFSDFGGHMIFLNADHENISNESAKNPCATVSRENAAYIIYTSGSTGQPKGVLVTHQNVVRLFEQTERWFGFHSGDVWTLFHSCAFDFSVWEIWGALLYGGRLVVVPYLTSRTPDDFYQLLAEEQVTVLNQTPSAFRQLAWAEKLSKTKRKLNLRYVIFGGEALELQSLRAWFDAHGDQMPRLVNMYGITETTVHVTYRPIRRADLTNTHGSVIGVPIPDLQIHLLDNNFQHVAACQPGEIFVGGAGVARGYLNQPGLTSERFIPDPFSQNASARLYRTGDLAQFHSNGELEYLGRIDQQVKIRGFRIELGEIEAALNRHPAIRESVVVAHENSDGEKRLVSYVVAHEPVSIGSLRAFLSERLPEYMVPSVFSFPGSLPLTPNGKVDRNALPPTETSSPMPAEFVAPENPIEECLAKIWRELLRTDVVGVNDHFFHLGGHSITAVQMLVRIRESMGVELSLQSLFDAPTLGGFAETVLKSLLSDTDNSELTMPLEESGQ